MPTSRRENDAIFRREQAPALLCAGMFCVVYNVIRATAQGRPDWDDAGIVSYELRRKLTVDISLLWQRRWHGEAVTEDWK